MSLSCSMAVLTSSAAASAGVTARSPRASLAGLSVRHAGSMNTNFLTCYKNELVFFSLSTSTHLPKEVGIYTVFLYLKRIGEPLGFSESVSSLEKGMFLVEIIVEVTKNLQLFCIRCLVLGLNCLMF